MRMMKTTLFLAAALAIALPGCGGATDAGSVLDVQIVPVEALKVVDGASAIPVEGARVIKFTVAGPGMSETSSSYDFTAGGGDLPSFPEGYERQLTVEICKVRCDPAVGDDIVSRGRSVPLTLLAGDDKRSTVFVSSRNAVVPTVKVGDAGPTAPERTTPFRKERVGASVTALDDGRLLIVGGARVKTGSTSWTRPEDLDAVYADAEIFDPRTGEYTAVTPMNQARAFHAAVKLGGPKNVDGRVVILGGIASNGGSLEITKSVEIFDPDTNSFVMEPEKNWLAGAGRAHFTAALAYPDQGVIFLAGGLASPSIAGGFWNLYYVGVGTIANGALSPGTGAEAGTVRWNHTMTWLPTYGKDADGKAVGAFVLMGGENEQGTVSAVEAYIVDPLKGGQYSVRRDDASVTELPLTGRHLHQAVYVARQDIVYVVGGFAGKGSTDPLDRVEVYRVGARGFNSGEYLLMAGARGGMSATLLDKSTIFIAGGRGEGGPTPRTEVIVETVDCRDSGDGSQSCFRVPKLFSDRTPDLDAARAGHAAVLDNTRRLFLLGGVSDANVTPDPVLYNPE